jgi:cytochrome c553
MVVRLSALPRLLFVVAGGLAVNTAWGADSPTNGRTLFENTATASGHAGLQSCPACHVNVDNRRMAIDPGGDLDFDLVFAHFTNAINTRVEMTQFAVLSQQQQRDIAAYIADVPKAQPNLVDFSASAVNTETTAVVITFGNAVTATSSLTIDMVGITGAASADFLIKQTGTTCANNLILASGVTCTVSVAFKTATGTAKSALLNVTYTQGGSSTTRTAQLNGTVAGQPPGSSTSAGGGGGGALPVAVVGLLLAAAFLRRRS